MRTTSASKLKLNSETLRNLSIGQLGQVMGGESLRPGQCTNMDDYTGGANGCTNTGCTGLGCNTYQC
jgi:hypothetical protein